MVVLGGFKAPQAVGTPSGPSDLLLDFPGAEVRRSSVQTVALLSLHLDDDVFVKAPMAGLFFRMGLGGFGVLRLH